MYVKHLQEYLDKFTNGKKGNAVSNAKIFIYVNGYLEEIKRIEVHEHAMSQPGAESIRIVLKPNREERLIVEAHGQRSSKTSSLFLYRGSRIMELDACGLKLEASTVGLEACCLELEACGLTLETLIV
jgi:hypothetical protein